MPDPKRDKLLGEVLAGKYRVERLLGEGGMGCVLQAEHLELHQRVAIKVMHADMVQKAEAVERFLREGRAAARLKNPHVAKVMDVGRLDDGSPFMVMELLEGQDLSAVLAERGALPASEAADYLLEVCEALAEAHGIGIVHRDLKPANLFLTQDAYGERCMKVLDFGISKSTAAAELGLTRTSAVMGSPMYMSPEQMRSSRDADHRTDIWALGTILYELVTGKMTWPGQSLSEVCVRAATDPTPRAADLVTGLHPCVDAVIERCLRKDPTARFADVIELAMALAPAASELGLPTVRRLRRLSTGGSRPAIDPVGTGPELPRGVAMKGTFQGTSSLQFEVAPVVVPTRTMPAWVQVGIAGVLVMFAGLLVWWLLGSEPGTPAAAARSSAASAGPGAEGVESSAAPKVEPVTRGMFAAASVEPSASAGPTIASPGLNGRAGPTRSPVPAGWRPASGGQSSFRPGQAASTASPPQATPPSPPADPVPVIEARPTPPPKPQGGGLVDFGGRE